MDLDWVRIEYCSQVELDFKSVLSNGFGFGLSIALGSGWIMDLFFCSDLDLGLDSFFFSNPNLGIGIGRPLAANQLAAETNTLVSVSLALSSRSCKSLYCRLRWP